MEQKIPETIVIRWIERNDKGKVVGTYANPQSGLDLEEIPEMHPDVVAFDYKYTMQGEKIVVKKTKSV